MSAAVSGGRRGWRRRNPSRNAMRRLVAGLAALVIVAVVAVLIFGGDDPELSPQDQATPTPTTTATGTPTVSSAATISVRIGDDGLEVEPLTVTRDGRTVFLDYDNTTDEAVEV